MFTIGNAATNQAFNHSGAAVDPTSPLYKELAAKYNYAEDTNFQDFIRSKIMEMAAKEAREKEEKQGRALSSSNNNNNNNGINGGDADVVPRGTTKEPKKKSRRSLRKALGLFFCF
ncbi:hypothetical protein PG997_005891 [Apiospora hydei]|uniref:Uncharacterized protein n=1 Tax=Apiospora hydei TaxID=1337664 RepID=A0ABR1WQ66_9PEZI